MSTKEQTVLEHLTELRQRLIAVLIAFGVTFLVGLYYSPTLYRLLTAPLNQKLMVLGPNDILSIYMSLASMFSISCLLPYISYQIWAYVRPALTPREARALLAYIPALFTCFLAGLAFGFYLVTPALLTVLLSLGEEMFLTQLTAQNYMAFVFHTTLPLGVLFEFPVLVAFLTQLGLLRVAFLVKYRRYAYFILICLAVILTPADAISDLVMSLPLIFIYELGVVISRLLEQQKGR